MKIVLQRVTQARVVVEAEVVGQINRGYVLLVGFETGDTDDVLEPTIQRLMKMRLFSDDRGRFNFNLEDVSGELLVVSQFTLSASFKKGKKPSFTKAMNPKDAERMYELFIEMCRSQGLTVQTGTFGAMMDVQLHNDGPVTIMMDTRDLFPKFYDQET